MTDIEVCLHAVSNIEKFTDILTDILTLEILYITFVKLACN